MGSTIFTFQGSAQDLRRVGMVYLAGLVFVFGLPSGRPRCFSEAPKRDSGIVRSGSIESKDRTVGERSHDLSIVDGTWHLQEVTVRQHDPIPGETIRGKPTGRHRPRIPSVVRGARVLAQLQLLRSVRR
jgi:hypothetical protein